MEKMTGIEEFMERCTYIACSFEIWFIPLHFLTCLLSFRTNILCQFQLHLLPSC